MASEENDISSMLTGGVITIYVGPTRKEYQVHKGLLASYKYWEKPLVSNLTKNSQTMHLPLQDPDTWDLFVNWLYRGNLKDIPLEKSLEKVAMRQARDYIMLYTQAEHWAIPALQNKIMDKLRAWTTSFWDWSPWVMIRYIYKQTPRNSPLRSFVVDSFLSKSSLWNTDCEIGGRVARLKSQLDYDNQEFVLECFEALMQFTPKSKLCAPDRKTACTYHKHEDGEECSK